MNTKIIRILFGTTTLAPHCALAPVAKWSGVLCSAGVALAIALLLFAVQVPMPVSSAPTIEFHFEVGVNTTADEYNTGADCSLREAIKTINGSADFGGCVLDGPFIGPGPTRVFVPSGVYTLTISGAGENGDATGDLDITSSMLISATGAVTVTRSVADRNFHVLSGNVTIRGLTIRGEFGYPGSGIRVESGASLSLYDSEVADNNAGAGAGISNAGGVTLTNVTVISNTVGGGTGGGIYNDSGAVASLINVILANNTGWYGAGIYNLGTANLTNVTLSDNQFAVSGGGIYNASTLLLVSVTLSGNSGQYGGGVYIAGGTATLNGVTLSGNTSGAAGGTFGGGGIYNAGGTATLANVTLSGNSAYQSGGGIRNYSGTANLTNVTFSGNSITQGTGGGILNESTATLTNTIMANSQGINCSGSIGGTANLSNDGTCGFGLGRDNVSAMLGPLANNGGATQTHALLPGSPAIDFGTDVGCPYSDQRGVPRPIGAHCDVGAYEARFLFLPLILK